MSQALLLGTYSIPQQRFQGSTDSLQDNVVPFIEISGGILCVKNIYTKHTSFDDEISDMPKNWLIRLSWSLCSSAMASNFGSKVFLVERFE